MVEIVRFDVECYGTGGSVEREHVFNRVNSNDNNQCWYPVWDEKVVTMIEPNHYLFKKNITHIHVTPISGVLEGLPDQGLVFRLYSSNASIVFGKVLEMIAMKAWKEYSFHSHQPNASWEVYAFVGIFEIDETDPSWEPPSFRGFLSMDERLTAIAIPEDCWVV